jgi:hypothetical protein
MAKPGIIVFSFDHGTNNINVLLKGGPMEPKVRPEVSTQGRKIGSVESVRCELYLETVRSVRLDASGIYRDSVWTVERREMSDGPFWKVTHWPTGKTVDFRKDGISTWPEGGRFLVRIEDSLFEVYTIERCIWDTSDATPRA